MLSLFGFALAFAALNRARGSKLFNLTTSTQAARAVSTFAMAVLTMLAADPQTADLKAVLLWVWVSLYFAMLPGWGEYVGFAIGVREGVPEKEFAPVDWLMRRLPIKHMRLWGGVAMGLRMALLTPCVIGLAYLTGGSWWWALATPLTGLVYVPCGLLFGAKGWGYGEYCAGGVIGVLLYCAAA